MNLKNMILVFLTIFLIFSSSLMYVFFSDDLMDYTKNKLLDKENESMVGVHTITLNDSADKIRISYIKNEDLIKNVSIKVKKRYTTESYSLSTIGSSVKITNLRKGNKIIIIMNRKDGESSIVQKYTKQ